MILIVYFKFVLIQHIESYSLSIENTQMISLVCQLITGFDMSHQTLQSFQHSKILLKCLEYEPNNYCLIYFTANYLSPQYRIDILNIICPIYTDNIEQGIEFDILSLFVSHYDSKQSSITIDCSKHTLACMHTYEKCGYSMKSAFTIEPQIYDEGDQIYDSVYLIPVFYHSLGPECVVKCQQFVEKHCLVYCLMTLSSRVDLLRAVVYNCLARCEQHLISQIFYCKEQILPMPPLLKQSITKSNLK
ncbi:unnamed protein product [Rotaria magnacalcarata]|uniref:Uncharacterized protein n=1 Tax=Rotaria magnacalcarata TaxID=392030 RepID=A0A819ZU90_9BILA|nr:unnamed protein product [Rotaria magnacalcarata]